MKDATKNEQYIIDESQEVSVGEYEGWLGKIKAAFPALQHRNYQLWFIGQLTSLIGTWIQMVAQGWLVLQLTNSAFWVGAISALGTLPVLLFGLFGGVIVDRYSKRRILFIAETGAMILAFILGFLTITGTVTVTHIAILAFLLGAVSAVDMPARLAFAVELVGGKKSLASALALNAGMFNAARVVGPGIAGLLIASIGLGGSFMVNGFTFIAVLIALYLIRVKRIQPPSHPHPIRAVKDGIRYSFRHVPIRTLLIFASITSIFGWSYATILPVVVKDVFHLDASGLALFNAVAGLGALIGSIILSAFSNKISFQKFIIGGSIIFSTSLVIFSFTSQILFAIPLLFFTGLGLIMQFGTINTTIQHMVDDSYRGRVMSIYSLMFLGMSPLGSLEVGYVAEHMGSQFAIRIGAIVVFLSAITIYLNRKNLSVKTL